MDVLDLSISSWKHAFTDVAAFLDLKVPANPTNSNHALNGFTVSM
jgi:hypothetical protein